jgi:hypothetical protein
LRTVSTTPSSTFDRRWASPRWITSGLLLAQATNRLADRANKPFCIIFFMALPQ